jgi:hypothetical protein
MNTVRSLDDFITEWAAGKEFKTGIGPVNIGLVGYATTKYGHYYLRFYSEFGASNTPQCTNIFIGASF